jgi:hypothetical protein
MPASAGSQSLTAELSASERRDRGQTAFQKHEALPGTGTGLGSKGEGLAEAEEH